MDDKTIAICRAAIVRICKLSDIDEQRQEVRKYPEPLRGVIGRGVKQVLEWRAERIRPE